MLAPRRKYWKISSLGSPSRLKVPSPDTTLMGCMISPHYFHTVKISAVALIKMVCPHVLAS